MDSHGSSVDPIELRRAFGTFVTGVTVVTTRDKDGTPRGMTANSFASVSLDPPLLLICIGKSASSYPIFAEATEFAVNFLHEDQKQLSAAFASKAADKFAGVNTKAIRTGAPVLTDSMTWFDCTVHNMIEAGDHIVLIGQVRASGTSPAIPLGFYRGRYVKIDEPIPAGSSMPRGMITGYLIEADDNILLRCDDAGRLSLPTANRHRIGNHVLLADGRSVHVEPEQTFLYSVFDVADSDPGYLIYRARLAADATQRRLPGDLQFFAVEDLPYDRMESPELKAVLRRYQNERQAQRFGIYIDSQDGGRVAMIESEGAYGA